jgi:hypothetical protein
MFSKPTCSPQASGGNLNLYTFIIGLFGIPSTAGILTPDPAFAHAVRAPGLGGAGLSQA